MIYHCNRQKMYVPQIDLGTPREHIYKSIAQTPDLGNPELAMTDLHIYSLFVRLSWCTPREHLSKKCSPRIRYYLTLSNMKCPYSTHFVF